MLIVELVKIFGPNKKFIHSTKFNRYAVLDVQVGDVSTIRQLTDRYAIDERIN